MKSLVTLSDEEERKNKKPAGAAASWKLSLFRYKCICGYKRGWQRDKQKHAAYPEPTSEYLAELQHENNKQLAGSARQTPQQQQAATDCSDALQNVSCSLPPLPAYLAAPSDYLIAQDLQKYSPNYVMTVECCLAHKTRQLKVFK